MVISQSAEGLIEHLSSERKGKGWKFALRNVKFWIYNYFFMKKFRGKDVCFFVGFECSRKGTFSDLLQNK